MTQNVQILGESVNVLSQCTHPCNQWPVEEWELGQHPEALLCLLAVTTWSWAMVLWSECLFPLKMLCWSLNAQCDGIWGQGLWDIISVRWGHRGGTPMMELVPLQEESPESLLSPPLHAQRRATRGQPPTSHIRRGLRMRHTLLTPWSWTSQVPGQNTFLLFKPPSLQHLLWQPEQTETNGNHCSDF